jgi:hypothetical protein
MTGQSGPNMQMMYEELCTFVDLHGGNWMIMHGMENVKFIVRVTFWEKKNALFCALYNTR